AAGDRVKRGAVGGDHAAVGGDVADQVAADDFGDAYARRVERLAAARPGPDQPRTQRHDHRHGHAADKPQLAPAATGCGRGARLVLGGGVADAVGSVHAWSWMSEGCNGLHATRVPTRKSLKIK